MLRMLFTLVFMLTFVVELVRVMLVVARVFVFMLMCMRVVCVIIYADLASCYVCCCVIRIGYCGCMCDVIGFVYVSICYVSLLSASIHAFTPMCVSLLCVLRCSVCVLMLLLTCVFWSALVCDVVACGDVCVCAFFC